MKVTVRPDVAAPIALMWIARRYCSAVSATLPAETSARNCSVSAASSCPSASLLVTCLFSWVAAICARFGDEAKEHLGMPPPILLGAGLRDRGRSFVGARVFIKGGRTSGGPRSFGSGAVVGGARIDLVILVGQVVGHVFASVWRADLMAALS
jgi:hypothetical protein